MSGDAADRDGPDALGPETDQQPRPTGDAERAADEAMAEASRAAAAGVASDDQSRRITAMDRARSHEERRRIWMSFDRPGPGGGAGAS